MKRRMRAGLVVAGNATPSPTLRLQSLADDLGPIKSSSLQIARRISNFLRAGYAVSEYSELAAAQLILLRVPDAQVPRIARELAESDLPFVEMAFVLSETWLPCESLQALKDRGASIATLLPIGPLIQTSFVLEGDLAAVRRAKRLLVGGGARAIEIRPGAKSLYFAAQLFATSIPVPILQRAQQVLRKAGVSGNDLKLIADEWAGLLQAEVRKGGRAVYGGLLAECAEETSQYHLEQLSASDSDLAARVRDWMEQARPRAGKRAKSQTA